MIQFKQSLKCLVYPVDSHIGRAAKLRSHGIVYIVILQLVNRNYSESETTFYLYAQ